MPSMQSQRTVYRLTLVKEWNVEQLEGYASLVTRGDPDFIEVKVKIHFPHILISTFYTVPFVFYSLYCLLWY